MLHFRKLVIEKFEMVKERGNKITCYGCNAQYNKDTNKFEVIPNDGEFAISANSFGIPKMLRVCTIKNDELVLYAFRSENSTFNEFDRENRYLLSYVYNMTKSGLKVDDVCIEDLMRLIEQLDR